MRLPSLKVYRAFSVLDALSDEECESHVRRVRANFDFWHAAAPITSGAIAFAGWAAFWIFAPGFIDLAKYIPVPRSLEMLVVALPTTGILVAGIAALFTRDLVLYLAIRSELARSSCRKCGQSLIGVPISTIGVDPDPAKKFVRCPECGTKFCLLDIGLTPRELIPFEQRGADPDIGKKRTSSRGTHEAWH